MMWKQKKWWPAATVLCLTTSSLLSAAGDEARVRNLENRVTALENSKNGNCLVNPAARPFAPDCWGFYVKVDPLIWQAHENGLPIALVDNHTIVGEDYGRFKNLSFNWDWGVRVGLGFNTTHDAWDVLAQWTYWKSTAVQHISTAPGGPLYLDPSQGDPQLIANLVPLNADANWDLNFNLLDLQNGRDFFVSKYLTMRPYMGLRSAWIKQSFATNYSGISGAYTKIDVSQKNRFWGIGILGGLDLQWGFPGGWSLFSNYSGSLMYGFYSVSSQQAGSAPSLTASDIINPLKNFYHVGTAIMDMQIGLRYDWVSCDECYHIGVDLGWENHYFPGQNQFFALAHSDIQRGKIISNQGDLSMQGYFVKLRFDF